MPERPVILIGFMGSGKSSVGRVLAENMSCPFIDLDSEVVAASGCSINDIFACDGEEGFRAKETHCLKQVLQSGQSVIATGGGVVVSADNRSLMRACGIVVNLEVSLPQVLQRLRGTVDRPLFGAADAPNHVKTLMDGRKQFYADADIRIDTDGKSVEDVAAEILCYVKGLRA